MKLLIYKEDGLDNKNIQNCIEQMAQFEITLIHSEFMFGYIISEIMFYLDGKSDRLINIPITCFCFWIFIRNWHINDINVSDIETLPEHAEWSMDVVPEIPVMN